MTTVINAKGPHTTKTFLEVTFLRGWKFSSEAYHTPDVNETFQNPICITKIKSHERWGGRVTEQILSEDIP